MEANVTGDINKQFARFSRTRLIPRVRPLPRPQPSLRAVTRGYQT